MWMCQCDTCDVVTKVEVQLCAGAVTALTQSGVNNSSSLGASGVKPKVVTAGKIQMGSFIVTVLLPAVAEMLQISCFNRYTNCT